MRKRIATRLVTDGVEIPPGLMRFEAHWLADVGYAVSRARWRVVPTLGNTASRPARGAPHPGHHGPRSGTGCAYHGPGYIHVRYIHILKLHTAAYHGPGYLRPRGPCNKYLTVPPRVLHTHSDSWTLGPARDIPDAGVHPTHPVYVSYCPRVRARPPRITALAAARGAPHPGHHGRGGGPGCADHSDTRGRNDPPPWPGHGVSHDVAAC